MGCEMGGICVVGDKGECWVRLWNASRKSDSDIRTLQAIASDFGPSIPAYLRSPHSVTGKHRVFLIVAGTFAQSLDGKDIFITLIQHSAF
jgi:hypothetical protein